MIVIVSKIVQTFDFDKLKKNAKPLLKDLAIASITDNPGELLKKRIDDTYINNNNPPSL